MKKSIIGLLAIFMLLSVSFALAEDEVHLLASKINNQVTPAQTASFDFTITNNNDFHDKYFLMIKDLDWNLQTEPITDFTSGIAVNAMSSTKTKILLKPSDIINSNTYYLEVVARSEKTGKQYSTFVSVNILPMVYEPKIDVAIEAPEKIDPKKLTTIKLILKNKNRYYFPEASVDIRLETAKSSLLSKKIKTGLKPLENKVIEFSVLLADSDAKEDVGEDQLKASIDYNGTLLSSSAMNIELIPHFTVLQKKQFTSKQTLKTIETYELYNNGSSEKKEDFIVEASRLKNVFTYTEPKAQLVNQNGDLYYLWNIQLNPGQKTIITVTTSYVPLFWLAGLILIIVILYFIFRTPIVAYKEVRDVEMKEGGISEVKVVLRIKNRSGKKVSGIRLIDKVPSIAEPIKSDGAETLKPDKYLKYEHGLALDWHFAHLEAKEERVITYKIRTSLSVLGDFKLPNAIVQFNSGNGKRKAYSNVVDVFSS